MACIPPTLEEWVYIIPIHGPLDGPLYTWAQYNPTVLIINLQFLTDLHDCLIYSTLEVLYAIKAQASTN